MELTVLFSTRVDVGSEFIAMVLTPGLSGRMIGDVENWGLQMCLNRGLMGD